MVILTLVDPDNVDPFNDDFQRGGGFGLTKEDSVAFLTKMAAEARRYGMSIGLKNAEDILPNVTSIIQFAVNEVTFSSQVRNQTYADKSTGMLHLRTRLQTIRTLPQNRKTSLPLRIHQTLENPKPRPHRSSRDAKRLPSMGKPIQQRHPAILLSRNQFWQHRFRNAKCWAFIQHRDQIARSRWLGHVLRW